MKDSQDRILLGAFKLFLENNYEKVSTPTLEQEIGLTRGSIFYKVRNKEGLFKAVIDRYILHTQASENKLSNIVDTSLKNFIDLYLERVDSTMQGIMSLQIRNVHRAYFNLIYQALQYYPGFDTKIVKVFNDDLLFWKKIIEGALKNREIKSSCDIELTAMKFRYIYSGLSFEQSLMTGLNLNELRNLYYSYYNEIKNGK